MGHENSGIMFRVVTHIPMTHDLAKILLLAIAMTLCLLTVDIFAQVPTNLGVHRHPRTVRESSTSPTASRFTLLTTAAMTRSAQVALGRLHCSCQIALHIIHPSTCYVTFRVADM